MYLLRAEGHEICLTRVREFLGTIVKIDFFLEEREFA